MSGRGTGGLSAGTIGERHGRDRGKEHGNRRQSDAAEHRRPLICGQTANGASSLRFGRPAPYMTVIIIVAYKCRTSYNKSRTFLSKGVQMKVSREKAAENRER